MTTTKKKSRIPKVGEDWRVKTVTNLPDRQHEAFVGEITETNGHGFFKVRPHGKEEALPIWFGLPWFLEKL